MTRPVECGGLRVECEERKAFRFVIARRPKADVAISQYPAELWESYQQNRSCLQEMLSTDLPQV